MQDFFLLNLQHHTSPLLDFPIHHSPINMESARCDVKVIKEGPSSEEGAYVWSLIKSWGSLHLFYKKRQLRVNCASLLTETFFSPKGCVRAFFWLRCMPMWRPMGVCDSHNSCNEVWKLWDDCHQDPAEEPFGVLRSWQVGVKKSGRTFWKPRSAWRSPLHQIWQFHIFGLTTHDLQCWFDMRWHDV